MTDMGTMLTEAKEYARSHAIRILRKHPDDVEDILQKAAINALRGIGRFRGTAQFKVWFTRIVINEARMRLRHSRAHDEKTLPIGEASENSFRPVWCNAPPSPEETAIASELRRAIAREAATWGQTLKEELRLMFLGVGPGTDNARKARRFRVRLKLLKALTERGLL